MSEKQKFKVIYTNVDQGLISEKDEFFESAIRFTRIGNNTYVVKYAVEGDKWAPYIEKDGQEYRVICTSKLIDKLIIIDGELIEYQTPSQSCYIEF